MNFPTSGFSSLADALGPLPVVQPPPPPSAIPMASFEPWSNLPSQSMDPFYYPVFDDIPMSVDQGQPYGSPSASSDGDPFVGLAPEHNNEQDIFSNHASDPFIPRAPEEYNTQPLSQPSFPMLNEAPTYIQTLSGYPETPYPFLPSFPISPIPPIPPFALNGPPSPLSSFAMAPISRAVILGRSFGSTQHSGLLNHSPFQPAYGAGYGAGNGLEDTGMPIQQHYTPPHPITLPSLPVNIRSTANPGQGVLIRKREVHAAKWVEGFHTGDERTFGSSSSTVDGIQTFASRRPQRMMGEPDLEDPFGDDQRPMGSLMRTPGKRRARRGAPYLNDYQTKDSRGHPLTPSGATTQHQASNPRERVARNKYTFGPSHDASQMARSSTSAVEQPTMPQYSKRSERINRDPNTPGSGGYAQRSLQAQKENLFKIWTAELLQRLPVPRFQHESPETLARSSAEADTRSLPSKGKSANPSARPSSSTTPPPTRPMDSSPTPPKKPRQYCRSTDLIPPHQSFFTAPVEDKMRWYADHAGGKLNFKVEPSPTAKADAAAALQKREEKKLQNAAARKERMQKADELKLVRTKTKKANTGEI